METTILKVLRDCKLTDGTQLRLASIQATGMIELSTTKGADNILAKIHLPYSVETAIELMSMGDKLCRIILQDEMGMVEVKDSFKEQVKNVLLHHTGDDAIACINTLLKHP